MINRVDLGRLIATPWKNGGGVTRELAAWPAGSGMEDFTWRISMAEVTQSGAFSTFPGIDRLITLLDGDGMQLVFCDGRQHDLTAVLSPFQFRGDDPLHARLIGSPCTDFNLMLRREAVTGTMHVWQQTSTIRAEACVAIVCITGQWQLTLADGTQDYLGAQHALTGIFPSGDITLQPLTPGSTLLGVSITYNSILYNPLLAEGARHGD